MLYMVGVIQDGIQGILMVDAMFICTGRPDDPHRFIVLQYWLHCKTILVQRKKYQVRRRQKEWTGRRGGRGCWP